jgi:hypothetical protein
MGGAPTQMGVPAESDDVLMGTPAAAPAEAAGFGNPDGGFTSTDSWSPTADADGGAAAPAPDTTPDVAPAPEFDASVGAADQMQNDLDSMTDNLSTSSTDGE